MKDRRPVLSQPQGDGQPDALRCPCYECDLSVECLCHRDLLFPNVLSSRTDMPLMTILSLASSEGW